MAGIKGLLTKSKTGNTLYVGHHYVMSLRKKDKAINIAPNTGSHRHIKWLTSVYPSQGVVYAYVKLCFHIGIMIAKDRNGEDSE
jgi:hypothetical protein